MIHLLTHSLTHSLRHSRTHVLTHSLTYSLIGHLHQLLNDDEVDDSTANPFNAAYSMTDDDGNDMELVFQPVHHGDEVAL